MRGSRAEDDYDDDDEEEEEDDEDAAPRGAATSEDESDFVSDYEAQEGAPVDEESELKQLEDVLREAKRQGIDLDLIVNGGLDVQGDGESGSGEQDEDDDDEEEEEEEVDDDDEE